MKRYNVTRKHTYTKNGEEKTTWKRVGSVIIFPATEDKKEGGIMELDMFNESYSVFPADNEKQSNAREPMSHSDMGGVESYDEPDVSDIPFQ